MKREEAEEKDKIDEAWNWETGRGKKKKKELLGTDLADRSLSDLAAEAHDGLYSARATDWPLNEH